MSLCLSFRRVELAGSLQSGYGTLSSSMQNVLGIGENKLTCSLRRWKSTSCSNDTLSAYEPVYSDPSAKHAANGPLENATRGFVLLFCQSEACWPPLDLPGVASSCQSQALHCESQSWQGYKTAWVHHFKAPQHSSLWKMVQNLQALRWNSPAHGQGLCIKRFGSKQLTRMSHIFSLTKLEKFLCCREGRGGKLFGQPFLGEPSRSRP